MNFAVPQSHASADDELVALLAKELSELLSLEPLDSEDADDTDDETDDTELDSALDLDEPLELLDGQRQHTCT